MRANAERFPGAGSFRGFSLLELMVVIAVTGCLLVLVASVMHQAKWRLGPAAAAADARGELELARARLLSDIRGACSAEIAQGGSELRLTGPDSRAVVWSVAGGRLIRTAGPDSRKVFAAQLAGGQFRVSADKAATRFVETTLRLPSGKGSSEPRLVYVASRTRTAEGGRQ